MAMEASDWYITLGGFMTSNYDGGRESLVVGSRRLFDKECSALEFALRHDLTNANVRKYMNEVSVLLML